ncbi:MAG TPA: dihydroxyacetone kinase subunit DhaL [Atribacteraceae bacterium]|nr:dihydroxyacetone kinase subunit DhaL [Atribacteraceae bacterium]
MAGTISFEKIKESFPQVMENLEKNRQYLNDLDAPIGDSDHGESVCNAFRKVKEAVEAFPADSRDIGALLQAVGKSIIFSGGAAMGPLYGTAFQDAGKAVAGKSELTPTDLAVMWDAFAGGVKRRGKVELGEKTMYDTIYPVAEALKNALEQGRGLRKMVEGAIRAAHGGMESTREMLSTRGRSSRLGDRSIGHIDPGSASSCIIIETFLTNLV